MKIFIAWSKDVSKDIGNALHDWLPGISANFTPSISTQDIAIGSVWRTALAEELQDADFGILCVTEDNLESPWLCYEAGALGISTAFHDEKAHKPHVAPILFGNVKAAQVASPIQDFQSISSTEDNMSFTRDNMLALVLALNTYSRSLPYDKLVDPKDITNAFNSSYKELEHKIQARLKKAAEERQARLQEAEEERQEAEEKRMQEKFDEFDAALTKFENDDSRDKTLSKMGKLLSEEFRNEGLREDNREYMEVYLKKLQVHETRENFESSQRLQAVLSDLIRLSKDN